MRDESKSASLEQLSAGLRYRTAVIGLIGLGYIRLRLM
jgi:UDP-N-acetyl-D-glucosamine dehydrogenase